MAGDSAPAAPGDEDLNDLYHKVWVGFAEDPVSASSEIKSSVKSYSNSPVPSSPNGSMNSSVNFSPPPARANGPSRLAGRRPLPPTPGPGSASPIPPRTDSRTSGYAPSDLENTDSHRSSRPFSETSTYSTDASQGLGRVTPVDEGRRLPSPPGVTSPEDTQSSNTSPLEYWNSPIESGKPVITTIDSVRPPPGALAATPPGYQYRNSIDTSSAYATNGPFTPGMHEHDTYSPTPDYYEAMGIPKLSEQEDPAHSRNSSEPWTSSASVTSPADEDILYDGYISRNPSTSGSAVYQNGSTNHLSIGDAYTNHDTMSGISVHEGASPGSYVSPTGSAAFWGYGDSSNNIAGPSYVSRRATDILEAIANYDGLPPDIREEPEGDEFWDEEEEDDESRFVNFSLLSHLAVQLRDKVPRGTHVKGSIPYPHAFTGKDIVSTIQSQLQRELAINHGMSTSDRRASLQVARSLQSQLFFVEVEWGGRVLQDGVEDVYMFLDDQDGPDTAPERAELPTGVVTFLTKCYSPSCGEGDECYSYSCPRKGNSIVWQMPSSTETSNATSRGLWSETVPREVILSLPESEINRQTIIHKLISKEEQYVQDLDIVDTIFIKSLRMANPPVMPPHIVEDFIDDVFGNILDLRECNRRLLEVMYVRQREQAPVIQRIGDIFLDAATEFRLAYPIYVGHHPLAEKRMKEELESNPQFRLFVEKCSRESARLGESPRLDLKHFLNRPAEHLQKYPVLLEAIFHETAVGNPDADYLLEAIGAIKNLQTVAQLRTFQTAMGKGVTGKWEWHDLVPADVKRTFSRDEAKRQSIIFELIKGEMAYVKDLENIELMYIRPLRNAEPPIVPSDRLDQFIQDVFHNFAELHAHHRRLVDKFHEIQRDEHPRIRSVTAAVFDAALNFRESYLEYIPNYPIAAYRIDDEMANNPAFKAFVEQCVRHPDAHRLDMKNFINRPIPRLLRYELLLKGILEETSTGHEDRNEIPQVLEVIKALGKDTEPGVMSAKQKVELWRYNSNIVFKPGEYIDMDLLDEQRSLVYAGKLLRQPDSAREWNWSELYVLLFDNYLIMTKPKEKEVITKYHVNRRPIPLDLLTLVNFTDPPTQRSTGLLRNLRGNSDTASLADSAASRSANTPADSRSVYPFTIHHNGRSGGPYILYAESAHMRAEWKQKLEEALGLRKVVQESNKVFEIETLSADTFLAPALITNAAAASWNNENTMTGKVTCSVPFNTQDGRGLVAIGCAEGVWIGFRHDSRSMRRVLHLKMVTQCAMLEDFGIFLVLADKSLFAYHIEALVPSSPQSVNASQTPQKLNGNRDVQFFSVGQLNGRTLVCYMKKKGIESVFHLLEPVIDKINERPKAPAGLSSRFGFRSPKTDWFRNYRDFVLPAESYDLFFLKARMAIMCGKGFEIMDLTDLKSVSIPPREDPRITLIVKRCESCRPLGMFRSNEDEFLLCYDEFGLHVNKHGDPSRSSGIIEWEGTAERAAFHAPYVLLFDTRFIEIRHVVTGRLAQIIPGNDVHCLWDGRGGLNAGPASPGTNDDRMIQEAQVHGVMNGPELPGRPPRAITQHVFELIPTIPLYLPGSLASPTSATYFPVSPHHSPRLRPMTSYRS